ncbi:MAG: hypothetical protein Kow0029_28870 [Candidatus Rifleibacteriota bacterium]
MLNKIAFLLVFTLITISGFAFDKADFRNNLNDLSEGIAQTAYTLSEKADSNVREAYGSAVERADKSEKRLRDIIANIETAEDFAAAQNIISEFAKEGNTNTHTAAFVEKMLKERADFINNTDINTSKIKVFSDRRMATAPEMVMNRRQRRMIMIETPVVEAVISLSDTKKNRRVDNLKAIFQRHECRILSENVDESGDDNMNNFYFSGKKYVVDALLGHFGGDIVKSDLKAIVKVTCGGFWSGKKSVTINVAPENDNGVMGDLSWFKSTIEKDPFKYFSNSGDMEKLAQIGSWENIAGEKKLLLKNAIVEIWVTSKNGTKKNAIYKNEVEFGDVYVSGR